MPGYQDGESRTINGVTYTRQGGTWQAQGAPASSGPIMGPPPKADDAKFIPGAPGYVLKSGQAQKIPGLPDQATNEEPGLDQPTTHFYAQQIIAGGQMPALGMGKAAAKARQEIMAEVARIGSSQGIGGGDLATQQAHYKAGQGAVANLEKQAGTIRANEQTALANGQQFIDRSNELPMQTQYPVINSITQGLQRNLPIPGHETISQMDAAYNTFVNEYAKVVAGTPNGGGSLSDSARHEAMNTIRSNASPSQKAAAFEQMRADMANRMQALNGSISQGYSDLTKSPAQAAADAEKAAAGLGVDKSSNLTSVYDGNNGGDGVQGQSTNGYKTVDAPNAGGLRGAYLAKLTQSPAPGELVQYLRSAGVNDPETLRTAASQAVFRRQHPDVKMSNYDISALGQMDVPLSTADSAMNTGAQTAPGAYAIGAANTLTANNLDSIAGAMGGNAQRVNIATADSQRNHPMATMAGQLSGGVMASMGGEGALARLGMAPGAGRAMLADTGYGAAAGYGAADDGNRLSGVLTGGVAGLIGSGVGQGLSKGVGRLVGGVSDPSVQAVADAGVPLTIGQAAGRSGKLGGMVKSIEDKATSLPIVGDMINSRRMEGVKVFNNKAFDKALEPINATVGDKVGEEAVADARDKVTQAFGDALKGKAAQVDHNFISDAAGPLSRLAPLRPASGLGKEVVDQIETSLRDHVDPANNQLTGEGMQAVLADLRRIRTAYKSDPLGHKIGVEVRGVEKAIEGMFVRQAPEVLPAYNAAKQAYRRVSTVADAVNKGKNSEGMFTPAQLGQADRANSVKYDGKLEAASGGAPFHDFQRPMQNVLPSKIGDSGTTGRAAVAAGAGYLAGGGGSMAEMGIGALMALAYSDPVQRKLVNAMIKRGATAQQVAKVLKDRTRLAGAVGATGAVQETSGGQ